MHCSRGRLLRRGLEFHVCTVNKSPRTKKKSGNLSYAPRIFGRTETGTKEKAYLQFIDQHIINKTKMRRKNAANRWMDYRKAFDIILQTWIIECQKIYKISDKVINFIMKSKKNWKVELTVSGKTLAKMKIKKDIFQGDSLSPLPFLIAIMPLNYLQGTTNLHNYKKGLILYYTWTTSSYLPKMTKNWRPG